MGPLAHTDSGAKISFYVLLGIFPVLELRLRVRSQLNQHGSRSDRNSFVLLYVSVVVAMAGAFALAANVHAAAISAAGGPIFVVGLVVMAVGIAVRQWAAALLGQFFTTDVRVHTDQIVVEDGPYRWVRHPSYTGLLVTFVGIGLALRN